MPTGPLKQKPEVTWCRSRSARFRVALRGQGRRWRLSGTAGTPGTTVTAMTTVTTRTAGTTRTERPRHHRRTTRPTGAHARGKWSTWEERRPLSRRRAFRAVGTERTEHAVVVVMMVMHGDRGAGEEDNRHHENDAGDDHHPRRNLVKPGRLRSMHMRRRRRRACGGRLDRGFGWLDHVSIMPTCAPVIKHHRQQVANDLPGQRGVSAGCIPS
jgi:hypothetical protein